MKVENSSKLNYGNLLFLFLTPPLSVLLGIWYIYENGLHITDILIFFSMYILTGMSITAGYHRCFSHKSYECHGIIKFFFLAFGAAAFENSAVEWCSDHRVHHKYSDKELDPYNPKKGFFWAHMGWILYHDKPDTSYSTIPDLLKSKLIMFQHRYYLPIAISFSFLLPFLIGMTYDRAFGALLFGGLLRLVFTHHSTFLINSAAHFFGKRTYCSNSSARDNWLLAIFTFGEGYHNFHHKFPADFRNGITRFSFDPTKWLIQVLSFLKLSWKLKETPEWSILRAKFQVQYDKLSQTIDLLPQNLQKELEPKLDSTREKFEKNILLFREQVELFQKRLSDIKEHSEIEKKKMKLEFRKRAEEFRTEMLDLQNECSILIQQLKAKIPANIG